MISIIEVCGGIPYATNGNAGMSIDQATHLFHSTYDCEYDVVPISEGWTYKIAFRTSQDEMWFKLKYG